MLSSRMVLRGLNSVLRLIYSPLIEVNQLTQQRSGLFPSIMHIPDWLNGSMSSVAKIHEPKEHKYYKKWFLKTKNQNTTKSKTEKYIQPEGKLLEETGPKFKIYLRQERHEYETRTLSYHHQA